MPVAEDERAVLSRPATAPDETITYGPNAENIADIRFGTERSAGRPLVLLIHGGFWRPRDDRLHLGPMAVALAEAGWTVANTEYRRVPDHPNLTIDDVSLALQMVPGRVRSTTDASLRWGIPPEATWRYGRHRGGPHLDCTARSRWRLQRICRWRMTWGLETGPRWLFLGEAPAGRADLDPKRMPSPGIGTTVIHGDEDDTVPIAVGESYAARIPMCGS